MRFTVIILILTILTGCGKENPDREIDSGLQDLVNTVESTLGKHYYHIVFKLEPLAPLIYGNCTDSVITISNSLFADLSEDKKELLLMHEIGHCAYAKDHDDSKQADGCPSSIMYSILDRFTDSCILSHMEEYTKEARSWVK